MKTLPTLTADKIITLTIGPDGENTWVLAGEIRLTEVSKLSWDRNALASAVQRSIALDQMLQDDLRALEQAGLIETVIDAKGSALPAVSSDCGALNSSEAAV